MNAPRGPLREVAYRLTLQAGPAPPQLPFRLVAAHPHLVVETRVAHLDDRGHVWRLLDVTGPATGLGAAREVFLRYRGPHLLEREILASSASRLLLWYKYRPPRGPAGFSHTAHAFQRLGRDTLLTDRTSGNVLTIRLLTRGAARIAAFLREAERRSVGRFGFEVLYVGPPRPAPESARLSEAERETLRAARELGYFGVPRRAGLRDIARRLGVSASAVSHRLRRAEEKLVMQALS